MRDSVKKSGVASSSSLRNKAACNVQQQSESDGECEERERLTGKCQ